jgi:hypothetical protein
MKIKVIYIVCMFLVWLNVADRMEKELTGDKDEF